MDDSEPGKVYDENDIFSMINEPEADSLYFAFRDNEKLIGYASIYDIDKTKSRAEFSFLIGDESYRGKGLGSKLLELICQKAREIGLAELYCSIYSENVASIQSVIKAGFKQTGTIKKERTEYCYSIFLK